MIEVLQLTKTARRITAGKLVFFTAGPVWILYWADSEEWGVTIAEGVFVSPLAWARSALWRAGFRPHWVNWVKR